MHDGQLLAMRGNDRLQAGNAVTVLSDEDDTAQPTQIFEQPQSI